MNNGPRTTAIIFTRLRRERLANRPANIARHPALVAALAKRGRVWGEGNPHALDEVRAIQREWARGGYTPMGQGPGWRRFNRQYATPAGFQSLVIDD